jgi:acetyl coenzyme A synthetase (ADP forming)-like protein
LNQQKDGQIMSSGVAVDFSRDVLLRDGLMLRMRVANSADRQPVVEMFSRCSTQTIRYRFLHLVKALPTDLLDQITAGTDPRTVALVVIQGVQAGEATPSAARVVAVGLYSVAEEGPEIAEVSFLVEDAMQRRGIGTILLDTLAELARNSGIARFSADVMADNRIMLSVFRKAGYGVSATTHYGVTHLEFPIEHSEVAEARAEAQEAEAERASLKFVFEPRSVAVIGASRTASSVGGALFRNLVNWGFEGTVYPVNPNAKSVGGVRAYPSVSSLPEPPDLVFVVVPVEAVLDSARECAASGARALCVISSGFAESGQGGADMQKELLEVCRSSGMRMVGPNCMGLVNTAAGTRLLGTFAPARPPAGNVAMSSQSGALGIALMDQATDMGLGVSSFISVGNKADVSGNDLIQYWEADEATEVILLYMESFGNPRKFARLARRVSRRKPIVAVKSGRTKAGVRAASSHTAALASSDRAATALFEQAGIIRVDTLSDFFFVGRLLAGQPAPRGRKVAILTNGGGPGILAADAADAAGLEIPPLAESTQSRLRAHLPSIASVSNPVDMTAAACPKVYRACFEVLCDDDDIDAVLVIFIPPLITPSAEVARQISESISARPELRKTVIAVFLDAASKVNSIPAGHITVPVYQFPEGAVAALGAAARYGTWRDQPAGRIADVKVDRQIIKGCLQGKAAGWLSQPDVAALLGAAGISVIRAASVSSPEEAMAAAAALGGPVALKVLSPTVLHKADVGGVMLGVSPDTAGDAYNKLSGQLASRGLALAAAAVSPMARPGTEVIAGITNDPVFGPLVAFGLGGYLVELLEDVSFRLLPLTDRDAASMIRGTRAGRLLEGYRGSPRSDIPAVEDLLLRLAALADSEPRILEIDLNPVIVHRQGEGLTIVDARVRTA